MYYFSVTKQTKAELDFAKEGKLIDDRSLIKILEKEGYCYLANLNLLILRDEQFISQIFGNAVFDEDYFRYLIETQKEACLWEIDDRKKSKDKKSVLPKINKFRVLIDSTK